MMGSSEIGVGSILLLSFIIFAALGYRKGAVKKIFSVLSLFLSLILAKLLFFSNMVFFTSCKRQDAFRSEEPFRFSALTAGTYKSASFRRDV